MTTMSLVVAAHTKKSMNLVDAALTKTSMRLVTEGAPWAIMTLWKKLKSINHRSNWHSPCHNKCSRSHLSLHRTTATLKILLQRNHRALTIIKKRHNTVISLSSSSPWHLSMTQSANKAYRPRNIAALWVTSRKIAEVKGQWLNTNRSSSRPLQNLLFGAKIATLIIIILLHQRRQQHRRRLKPHSTVIITHIKTWADTVVTLYKPLTPHLNIINHLSLLLHRSALLSNNINHQEVGLIKMTNRLKRSRSSSKIAGVLYQKHQRRCNLLNPQLQVEHHHRSGALLTLTARQHLRIRAHGARPLTIWPKKLTHLAKKPPLRPHRLRQLPPETITWQHTRDCLSLIPSPVTIRRHQAPKLPCPNLSTATIALIIHHWHHNQALLEQPPTLLL